MWRLCVVAASGAGLTHIVLSSSPMTGAGPMLLGLLVAWAWACGNEIVSIPCLGPISARRLALIAGVAGVAGALLNAGWIRATVCSSGGASAWIYLWWNHQRIMRRPGRAVGSERMSHLEL